LEAIGFMAQALLEHLEPSQMARGCNSIPTNHVLFKTRQFTIERATAVSLDTDLLSLNCLQVNSSVFVSSYPRSPRSVGRKGSGVVFLSTETLYVQCERTEKNDSRPPLCAKPS